MNLQILTYYYLKLSMMKANLANYCMSETDLKYLSQMIQDKVKNSLPFPFLQHVDYFKDEKGQITQDSIKHQWHKLTGEHLLKTTIKAKITMSAANQKLSKCPYMMSQISKCPYQNKFITEHMMPLLKHPKDTGVVNSDGSINIDNLEKMIALCFEKGIGNIWYIRHSVMNEFLKQCSDRDQNKPNMEGFFMPSWSQVAWFEWRDAFNVYSDHIHQIDDFQEEKAITLETFLQFYFECAKLNQRVLNKELPCE